MDASDDGQDSRWLLQLLRKMDGGPQMYLGAEDIETLRAFVAGYHLALLDAGLSGSERILDDFDEWLAATEEARQIGVVAKGAWWYVIPRIDPSAKNVRTFYRLFRQFLVETGRPPL